jgi:glycosyltransferase involved in cell wall biosynthesis
VKILVVGSDIPATSNMPGSPRLFSLCRYLAQRHSLTLATLSQSQERYQEFLADPTTAGVFDDVVVLPSAPDSDWFGAQIHRLRQAPYFITRYRAPRFYAEQCQRIREMYLRGGYDAIFVDGIFVAQYVEGAHLRCAAIIDLHDSITLLSIRTGSPDRSWLGRLHLNLSVRKLGKIESHLSRTFGAIIVNSSVDEAFLRKLNPSANTLTIGNGVDSDFFSPGEVQPDMTKIVFTGVMNYEPNEDAALHFAETILPVIQKRHPQTQFWVVGKAPGPKLQALAARPGIHVTGGVPDIRPYARAAGVVVSPLRFGTGVKNKLLAALSMKKAVVATSTTIEGLEVVDRRDLLVADDPADFAAKVIMLIENPEYGNRLAESGYEFVRKRYSWESSARQLEQALIDVVNRSGVRQAR